MLLAMCRTYTHTRTHVYNKAVAYSTKGATLPNHTSGTIRWQHDGVMLLALRLIIYLIWTILVRSATFRSTSYPNVLMRLDGLLSTSQSI